LGPKPGERLPTMTAGPPVKSSFGWLGKKSIRHTTVPTGRKGVWTLSAFACNWKKDGSETLLSVTGEINKLDVCASS